MKIYSVDFENLLKNYAPYHDSIEVLNADKENFTKEVEKIKTEMRGIINSSKSLILDSSTQEVNQARLNELNAKGLELETEFRSMMSQKQSEELEKNFNSIMEYVNTWSSENSADLIVNKNSIVYVNPKFDITEKIIDVLKQNNMFKESLKEEVVNE